MKTYFIKIYQSENEGESITKYESARDAFVAIEEMKNGTKYCLFESECLIDKS